MKKVKVYLYESATPYGFDDLETGFEFATEFAAKTKRPLFTVNHTCTTLEPVLPVQSVGMLMKAVENNMCVAIIITFELEAVAAKEQT